MIFVSCSSFWLDVHCIGYHRPTLLPFGYHLPLTISLCTSLSLARTLTSSMQLVLISLQFVLLVCVFLFNLFPPESPLVGKDLLWTPWHLLFGHFIVALALPTSSSLVFGIWWFPTCQVLISSSLLLMHQLLFFCFVVTWDLTNLYKSINKS